MHGVCVHPMDGWTRCFAPNYWLYGSAPGPAVHDAVARTAPLLQSVGVAIPELFVVLNVLVRESCLEYFKRYHVEEKHIRFGRASG